MASRFSVPWVKINDFIATIGAEPDLESLFKRALVELPRLIAHDQCFACFLDIVPHEVLPVVSLISRGGPTAAHTAYLERYWKMDSARPLLTPATRLYSVDWLERRWSRDPFANEFVRGLMRITMNAGIPLIANGGRSTMIFGLARSGAGTLCSRDEAILAIIRPHLANLFALHKRRDCLPADLSYFSVEMLPACHLLSRREAEVATHLCRRLRVPEIATLLMISPRTVERHVQHIYEKLEVGSRRELLEKLQRRP
jgi:DNA-binding CsgD family transcriptional regulator